MRLDKFLSHTGFGSRAEVKKLIKKKQVVVNGQLAKEVNKQIDEYQDVIQVGGEKVVYEKFVYYLLNKPAGVITATEDKQHRTVLDLLSPTDWQEDLFPVGRLDKDTTGLLIITNDGKTAHDWLSPKKHVTKVYQALVEGVMTKEDQQAFFSGMVLSNGEVCLPAELTLLQIDTDKQECLVEIKLSEGKYHQVKRMVAACGKHVKQLHRKQMGNLVLPEDLKQGEYCKMDPQKI